MYYRHTLTYLSTLFAIQIIYEYAFGILLHTDYRKTYALDILWHTFW